MHTKKMLSLIKEIASDADLGVNYPQYRQAAAEILDEILQTPSLTWTIREEGIDFPSDATLLDAAKQQSPRNSNKDFKFVHGTYFAVQRFGNSAHVYLVEEKVPGKIKRVGLFTWGMTKEA